MRGVAAEGGGGGEAHLSSGEKGRGARKKPQQKRTPNPRLDEPGFLAKMSARRGSARAKGAAGEGRLVHAPMALGTRTAREWRRGLFELWWAFTPAFYPYV